MEKILLLLVLPFFVFAQYSNQMVPNGDCELDANWSNDGFEGGETNERNAEPPGKVYEGTYSRHILVDGAMEGAISDNIIGGVTSGVFYRYTGNVYIVSGQCYISVSGSSNWNYTNTISTTGSWQFFTTTVAASGTGNIRQRFRSSGTGAAQFYFDDIRFRRQLGTIYISSAGNDAAAGEIATPIQTCDECDTRGYYSGGAITFVTDNTGTLDVTDDVTINGTDLTVAAINCGANAVTLEGNNFTITTLTGTNITDNRTVTSADKDYGGYGGYKGY